MNLKRETIQASKQKDVFITKTAIKTLTSEHIVEKVISHQFRGITKALKKDKEVEISGFGKFVISQAKIRKKIKKIELAQFHLTNLVKKATPQTVTPDKMEGYCIKMQGNEQRLQYLKARLHEPKEHLGGVEESPLASSETEGGNREDLKGEVGDLQRV